MHILPNLTDIDIVLTPFVHDWDFLTSLRRSCHKPLKIMSKNTFFGRFYYGNKPSAIHYLIEKYHLTYDEAMTMVKEAFHPLLGEIDDEKVDKLLLIRQSLLREGIYHPNKYIHHEFVNKKIALIGYNKSDTELFYLLEKLGAPIVFWEKEKEQPIQLPCASFDTLEDEVSFVFQQVAALIQKGVAPQDLTLVVRDQAYDYTLRYFSYHFSLPINIPSSVSLYTLPIAKGFLLSPSEETIAPLKLDKNETMQQVYGLLRGLLIQYPQGNLSFTEYQSLMRDLLKITMLPSPRYQNGISVTRNLPFDTEKPVFILGFNEKIYPRLTKDDDYFSNEIKTKLHRNTSSLENRLEKDNLLMMLPRYKLGYITFKYESNDGEFYPSPIIEEMKITVSHKPWVSRQFSQKIAEIDYATRLDAVRKYRSKDEQLSLYRQLLDIPYLRYNSSFTGVSAVTLSTQLNLSYSKISDYYKCPFLYYSSHLLKLNAFEDSFKAKYGSLTHNVLMHRYQENYDFDRMFDHFVNQGNFSPREQVFLIRLKEELRQVDSWLSDHERLMNRVDVICEKDIDIDIDAHTRFSGRIDKMYVTTDGTKKYIFVIDYKTSNEAFKEQHIDYGFSLQLPIYAFLIANEPLLSKYELSGLYIQPILLNQDNAQKETIASTNYQKAFRYAGVTTNNLSVIATFDRTYDQNNIIAGKIMNNDGSTHKNAMIRNSEFFQGLSSQAEAKINEAIAKIRSNQFGITPRTVSSVAPCKYCAFRHLCFRKDTDVEYIKTAVKEENSDE